MSHNEQKRAQADANTSVMPNAHDSRCVSIFGVRIKNLEAPNSRNTPAIPATDMATENVPTSAGVSSHEIATVVTNATTNP